MFWIFFIKSFFFPIQLNLHDTNFLFFSSYSYIYSSCWSLVKPHFFDRVALVGGVAVDVDATAGATFSFAITWPFFNGLSGTTFVGDGVAGSVTAAFTFDGVTFFTTGTTALCFFSTTISTANFTSTKIRLIN